MIKKFMMAFICLLLLTQANSQSFEYDGINELAYLHNSKAVISDFIQEKNSNISQKAADKISKTVLDQSEKLDIAPGLLLGIIWTESKYIPNVKSNAGAKGLMQVIPYWHKDKIKNRNIFDIATNIEVGSKIISDCLDKKNSNLTKALACYSGNTYKTVGRYKSRVLNHKKEFEQYTIISTDTVVGKNKPSFLIAWQSDSAQHR